MFGQGQAWLARRPQVDLAARPLRVNLSPSPITAVFGLVFGGFWLYGSLNLVSGVLSAPSPAIAFALMFPAIGLAAVGASLVALITRRYATFDAEGVAVEGRTLRGRERWFAAYPDFAGVRHREHTINRKHGSTTYQIIELVHPEPAKTLPLYVAVAVAPPRERWESYARELGLPALELAGERVITRAIEDLDKSLKELAREGRLDARYDPAAPPPPGLRVVSEGAGDDARLRVIVTAPRIPYAFAAMFATIPVAMIAAAATEPGAWPMVGVGLLFLAAMGWMAWYDRTHPRELRLSRHDITMIEPWLKTTGETTLPLTEIESVSVARARSNIGRELIIAGDKGRLATGAGLSGRALSWLREFVTAAIATA